MKRKYRHACTAASQHPCRSVKYALWTRVREPLTSELLCCSLPVEFPPFIQPAEPLSFAVICCDRREGKTHSSLEHCQIIVTFPPPLVPVLVFGIQKKPLFYGVGHRIRSVPGDNDRICSVSLCDCKVTLTAPRCCSGQFRRWGARGMSSVLSQAQPSVLWWWGGLSFLWLNSIKTDFLFMASECAGV